MSLEKDQFDLVYKEAFASGTGDVFDPGDPGYRGFVDHFVEDHVTRPDLSLSFYPRNEFALTLHPYSQAWTETDIQEIAKIAYLGRALIDCARTSLLSNPEWRACSQSTDGGIDNKVAQFLQFSSWVEAHPDDLDPDRAKDPDVASPLRLASWPRGSYINCLGHSIALAAAAELDEQQYVYANEIRFGNELTRNLHKSIRTEVEKICLDFFVSGGTMQQVYGFVDRILSMAHDSYKDYENIFFDDETAALSSSGAEEDEVRDWHHSIICADDEEADGTVRYRQLDPYMLTFGPVCEDAVGIVEQARMRPEAALVIDGTDEHRQIERSLHSALKNIRTLIEKNKRQTGRRTMIEDLIDDAVAICADVLVGDEDDENFRRAYIQRLRRCTKDALHSYRITQAADMETAEKFIDFLYGQDAGTKDEFYELDQYIIKRIEQSEGADPRARVHIRDICNYGPLFVFMQAYSDVLHHVWNIKQWGFANTTMEVGHPEFMIGAMYLNHYATYRKDGRINVARYLVRYSASQLIWQVAQLDNESIEDPSLEAVGELVAQLPARQQHPRVALTFQSQPA